MQINFIPIRVGHFRKNQIQERILKENYLTLKRSIIDYVKSYHDETIIELAIIIPAKGYRISISLDNIKDHDIRKLLISNFSDSIYHGKYDTLIQNSSNLDLFPIDL